MGGGEDDVVLGSQAAGAKAYKAPRKRGHSKNGRDDAPQIVVGLAVTRDGLPVRHWMFPGNTVDVTTVEQVKRDLRGWQLGRSAFVGDAGMVSKENLRKLSLGGGRYIVNMPMRRGDEVTDQVLSRAGRFRTVQENLRVKEVVIGDGERRRRYVLCHNPDEEARQRHHREQILHEFEAQLATLADHDEGDTGAHGKRACQLRASRRYRRFLCLTKGGRLEIDRSKVRAEERLDGKFVVHSNDDTLSADDLALGYKQLMRVEQAWRTPKSGLKMRSVFHWAVHRIHAHISITVLATTPSRARRRERVRRHLAQHPRRPPPDQARAIVGPQRRPPADHRPGPSSAQPTETTQDRQSTARRRPRLIAHAHGPIRAHLQAADPALESRRMCGASVKVGRGVRRGAPSLRVRGPRRAFGVLHVRRDDRASAIDPAIWGRSPEGAVRIEP